MRHTPLVGILKTAGIRVEVTFEKAGRGGHRVMALTGFAAHNDFDLARTFAETRGWVFDRSRWSAVGGVRSDFYVC